MKLDLHTVPSPVGPVLLVIHDDRLVALYFADRRDPMQKWLERRFGTVEMTRSQRAHPIARRIADYFAGDLGALDGIAVDTGGTRFQRQVWRGLLKIRPGATLSYGELARTIGRPRAVRAVGAANGANPVSLVIPCHRVIGADGTLTGYGGGMERKRWLLEHESGVGSLQLVHR